MKIQDLIPNVEYSNNQYKFKNIFHKFNLRTDIEDKFLQIYNISDGESLEDISFVMYDDPIYYWIIIIINNINDPIYDLPLPEDTIQEIARNNSIVDGEVDIALYSTNYDDLTEENDSKRNIKVLKREYLSKFLTEMIRQSVE